ncbi:metallophosphoesterase [Thalassolituus pacificus]|uniref:Metallophosphoesterase n=1 Tax=Thalassolituus pacificus TaxID=2975440 RepID=A0A9X2WJR9_9GAMM|nr:metallophosphoesterase [Thalassolituus pacificus]MCT7361182.1 metallophosphoesterase [Thalassolituus pacificus]
MLIQPRLLRLGKNPKGRDFVVGDLHGCVPALHAQLQRMGFDKNHDRLICTGDLVDRGPQSPEALALLDEPWFFAVIGNHEQLLYEAFREDNATSRELILLHGGDWILQHDKSLWDDWFRRIEQLPLAIELINRHDESVAVIHADFPLADWQDFDQLDNHLAERAIWAREPFKQQTPGNIAGIDWIIYGHNVTEHELRIGNRLYIDAGAFLARDFIIKDIDQL